MKAEFLTSGVKPSDYPLGRRPEVAFVGRSNAGKSSLLNALIGQKVARVSQTPGKTRLLNFFAVANRVVVVDMPGYGFATGNRQEVAGWKLMIETYLAERETLRGVLLIMDIRRDWSADEQMLREWFEHHQTPWGLVLNKADKLSRSAAKTRQMKMRALIGPGPEIFAVSSRTGVNLAEVENLVLAGWGR